MKLLPVRSGGSVSDGAGTLAGINGVGDIKGLELVEIDGGGGITFLALVEIDGVGYIRGIALAVIIGVGIVTCLKKEAI